MINFYNSTTQKQNFKPIIKLLGSGDNIEITQYEMGKNSMFFIKPSLKSTTYEFYYIVNGQVEYNNNLYSKNDYFDLIYSDQDHGIKILEDTVILYIASDTGEFENANRFNELLIEQLEVIQKKDHYTFEHCKRVKRLALSVGKALMLKDTDLKNLTLAAYFHDIGKIKISDKILNKPGSLTLNEYDQMKMHVTHGHEIIAQAIDQNVADILVLHHERLNGSGYPKGLLGKDIPLLGRILAVVDSYDAMTSNRIYHIAKDTKTAIKELYELSDQYDQEVVKALSQVVLSKKS